MPLQPTIERLPLLLKRGRQSLGVLQILSEKGVLTMSTDLASDWVVYRPDSDVLGMFSGVPCVFGAWNAVRVPPRAQHSPSSEGFLL